MITNATFARKEAKVNTTNKPISSPCYIRQESNVCLNTEFSPMLEQLEPKNKMPIMEAAFTKLQLLAGSASCAFGLGGISCLMAAITSGKALPLIPASLSLVAAGISGWIGYRYRDR